MTEYWFARYKPAAYPQRASKGLIALNWKGRATVAVFVLCMVLGGVSMLVFGLRDQMQWGIPSFIVLATCGAVFFIWASVAKTDPVKSAYDYLAERKR